MHLMTPLWFYVVYRGPRCVVAFDRISNQPSVRPARKLIQRCSMISDSDCLLLVSEVFSPITTHSDLSRYSDPAGPSR